MTTKSGTEPSMKADNTQTTEEQNYITNPQYKIKPIKPTRMEWRAIISAKQLRQRIAQVRLAATFGKGQSFYVSQGVIDSFKSRKPFRMNQKVPGRKKQYSFQTDGNTLFQLTPDVPQKRYEIAKWDKKGDLMWSFQNHDSASTIQAGKMLGIDIERKGGQMFVNGKFVDHNTLDYTKIPKGELQSGFVSKGKGRK